MTIRLALLFWWFLMFSQASEHFASTTTVGPFRNQVECEAARAKVLGWQTLACWRDQ